jgi:hypothetical protein
MKFFVTTPVEGSEGYPYWDVREAESSDGPNFSVASFFKKLPNAEKLARDLCRYLNEAK